VDNNTYVEQALAIEALNMVGRFGTRNMAGCNTRSYQPHGTHQKHTMQDGWMDG